MYSDYNFKIIKKKKIQHRTIISSTCPFRKPTFKQFAKIIPKHRNEAEDSSAVLLCIRGVNSGRSRGPRAGIGHLGTFGDFVDTRTRRLQYKTAEKISNYNGRRRHPMRSSASGGERYPLMAADSDATAMAKVDAGNGDRIRWRLSLCGCRF